MCSQGEMDRNSKVSSIHEMQYLVQNYFSTECTPYISYNSKGTKLQRQKKKQHLGIPRNGYQV